MIERVSKNHPALHIVNVGAAHLPAAYKEEILLENGMYERLKKTGLEVTSCHSSSPGVCQVSCRV